jgi:MerR family transcriptional regulator/heat shock protein HspR
MQMNTERTTFGEVVPEDQPCYVISVAARIVGVHAQTLRYYERVGLVEPARSQGNIRLYSRRDVQLVLWIKSLMEDLGINLAGAEVIMRMSSRMAELEREIRRLAARLEESTNTEQKASVRRRRSFSDA